MEVELERSKYSFIVLEVQEKNIAVMVIGVRDKDKGINLGNVIIGVRDKDKGINLGNERDKDIGE